MKFNIEHSNNIGRKLLVYLPEECSFYTGERAESKIDLELILNKLSLSVVDDRIVDVNGFCGLDKSMLSLCQIPEYKKGVLKVEHNLDFGFAYGINDNDLPVYVNTQTGWVCLGFPEKEGKGVEFINNCVAFINDVGEFLSLWLKPTTLPKM